MHEQQRGHEYGFDSDTRLRSRYPMLSDNRARYSWTNFHTHSRFCDAPGDPELYVQAALERHMTALGFSSHAPLPFPTHWTMKPENLAVYCARIRELKEKYRGQIDIYLGLEIDYFPGCTGPHAPQFLACGLDYCLGSVHYAGQFADGSWWVVDGSDQEFVMGLREIYKNDAEQAVCTYYARMRDMVAQQTPDVVGHLDVIKKNNRGGKYFSEDAPWYRKAVEQTLAVIAKSKAVLEINTGGLARGTSKALYPSPWIIRRCHELRIPIMLNADAHRPEQIIAEFPATAQLLREIGFKELMVLTPAGWQARAFDENGISLSFQS
jgi:histidinol-phosphatase (PHP family)